MMVTHVICDGCGAEVKPEGPEKFPQPQYHRIVMSEQTGIQSTNTKSYDLCEPCGSLLNVLFQNHSIQKVLKAKSNDDSST